VRLSSERSGETILRIAWNTLAAVLPSSCCHTPRRYIVTLQREWSSIWRHTIDTELVATARIVTTWRLCCALLVSFFASENWTRPLTKGRRVSPLPIKLPGPSSNTKVCFQRYLDRLSRFCKAHGRDQHTDGHTCRRRHADCRSAVAVIQRNTEAADARVHIRRMPLFIFQIKLFCFFIC